MCVCVCVGCVVVVAVDGGVAVVVVVVVVVYDDVDGCGSNSGGYVVVCGVDDVAVCVVVGVGIV